MFFVLDGMDFLVVVFVVTPVFFGARTKNWYLKQPKYLIKYDLLNLIILQRRFKRKNL